MPIHPVDVAVALIAEQQEGNFSVAQAKAAGADDGLVHRRIRSGRWLRRHAPAVLHLPGAPLTELASVWVALLDAGPTAMASHETAAALHRVSGFRLTPPAILVPHGRHHVNAVATVHQSRLMPEAVAVDGVPATPLLRTTLDLASVVRGPVRMGHVVDELVVRRSLTLAAVVDGLDWMARHARPGTDTLRRALAGRTHGYVPSRSELERLLDAIVATIPGPPPSREVDLPNRESQPHRVDRLFRDPPLIVEGDGRLWHARLEAMERDKRRDRAALALGYPTVRYSWHELYHEAREVRAELLVLLGRSDSRSRSRSWSV